MRLLSGLRSIEASSKLLGEHLDMRFLNQAHVTARHLIYLHPSSSKAAPAQLLSIQLADVASVVRSEDGNRS